MSKKKEHVITETDGFAAIPDPELRAQLVRIANLGREGQQTTLFKGSKTKKKLYDEALNAYNNYCVALARASKKLFGSRKPVHYKPYDCCPEEVLMSAVITDLECRVYIRLLHYHDLGKGCFPSQKTLASDLKKSIRTIQRALEGLWKKRYLTIGTRKVPGHQTSNMYILNLNDNRVRRQ